MFPLFIGLEAQSLGWDWLLAVAKSPALCAAMLIATAVLSVSTLPVWSFKNFKVPAQFILPLLLGTGLFVALLVADPWAAMAAAGILYVVMLPFSARSFRRLKVAAEGSAEPTENGTA